MSEHIDTIRAAVVSAWPEKVPAALAALEQLAGDNARLRAACKAALDVQFMVSVDWGEPGQYESAMNQLRAALGETTAEGKT